MAESFPDLTFLNGASEKDWRVPLLGDQTWIVNNSPLDEYCRDAPFADYAAGLEGLLREHVGLHPDNVGMDLAGGSQGRAARDLLDLGILGRALVTNYQDRRSEEALAETRLDHITGDLTKPQTWGEIINWQRSQAPEGLALIMHRPVGALAALPTQTYVGAARTLLNMLRPGGLLFAQVPRAGFWHPESSWINPVCADLNLGAHPNVARVHVSHPAPEQSYKRIFAAIVKAT